MGLDLKSRLYLKYEDLIILKKAKFYTGVISSLQTLGFNKVPK